MVDTLVLIAKWLIWCFVCVVIMVMDIYFMYNDRYQSRHRFALPACHDACNGCTGEGPNNCVDCMDGFYPQDTMCKGWRSY